jgi:peptidyl-prolyl cis-trans isomerase SurA
MVTLALRRGALALVLVSLGLVSAPLPVQADMLEEIVAWVNGEIITKSDLEEEEQLMIAEAYKRFTGDELDQQVAQVREGLLLQMIDRKILINHAEMLYDIETMSQVFYEGFMEQQNITNEEELERLLAQDGMTVEELKEKLVEMLAPDEVIRFEVNGRISVGEAEIQAYYDENPELFTKPGEVTFREIVLLADTEAARAAKRPQADAILERLASGEDFAEVAKQVSEAGTRAEGGLMSSLKRGDLSEQLDSVVFSLPVGGTSDFLEMPYGLHLIKVEERTDASVAPLEEVHENLRRALEDQKYFAELQGFMEKAREEAEWCVKPKYRHRIPVEPPVCERL